MSDDPTICGVMDGDSRAWVPMADHEALRRRKELLQHALLDIVARLNKLADDYEREVGKSWDEPTGPAPLDKTERN